MCGSHFVWLKSQTSEADWTYFVSGRQMVRCPRQIKLGFYILLLGSQTSVSSVPSARAEAQKWTIKVHLTYDKNWELGWAQAENGSLDRYTNDIWKQMLDFLVIYGGEWCNWVVRLLTMRAKDPGFKTTCGQDFLKTLPVHPTEMGNRLSWDLGKVKAVRKKSCTSYQLHRHPFPARVASPTVFSPIRPLAKW